MHTLKCAAGLILPILCLMLSGCGTEKLGSGCPAAGSCGCGGVSNVCMGDSIPLLYATTTSDQILAFSIDTTSGTLTPVPGSPFAVGNGPGALAEDNFNHLYVLNGVDHTISALSVGSNGTLTAIGSPVPTGTSNGGMACCTNNQLFVADTDSMSIDIFSIDSTGALTPSAAPLPVPTPPLQLIYVGP
jgi:hypothetical protein